MSKHQCPEDPDVFFGLLELYLTYRRDPPEGYTECRICGDFYPVTEPEEKKDDSSISRG